MNCEKFNLLEDVYYSKEYAELYLNSNDEVFTFEYRENEKIFYNIAIKKPIIKINDIDINEGYFDLETPYGYGGYYTNTLEEEFIKKALSNYSTICIKNNIIAEFIRFHPFNTFSINFSSFLDFIKHDRDVVIVDLNLTKEQRAQSYDSSTRNKIRKGAKNLIFREDSNLEDFIKIYYQTMDKNKAEEFYYFNSNYFNKLLNLKNCKLFGVYNREWILSSGAIFLEGKDIVSYHLGAKNYSLNIVVSNYYLFDSIFDYYSKIGKHYALLGGGKTSDKQDSLFLFKSKFSKLTLPFYIGGKIFNKELYDKYCNLSRAINNKFLKYRYN